MVLRGDFLACFVLWYIETADAHVRGVRPVVDELLLIIFVRRLVHFPYHGLYLVQRLLLLGNVINLGVVHHDRGSSLLLRRPLLL